MALKSQLSENLSTFIQLACTLSIIELQTASVFYCNAYFLYFAMAGRREVGDLADIICHSDSGYEEVSDFKKSFSASGSESDNSASEFEPHIGQGIGEGDRVNWQHIDPATDNYVLLWYPIYSKMAGPQLPPSLGNALMDFFSLLFPGEAFQVMCDQTNNHASEFLWQPG